MGDSGGWLSYMEDRGKSDGGLQPVKPPVVDSLNVVGIP